MYVCMYVCIYIYIYDLRTNGKSLWLCYSCMYVCVCVCMYIYIYMYIYISDLEDERVVALALLRARNLSSFS